MELKNKHIVLTGSKGLIGKAIMKEFKKKNKIISIDLLKIQKQKNVDHYICDLEDRKDRTHEESYAYYRVRSSISAHTK